MRTCSAPMRPDRLCRRVSIQHFAWRGPLVLRTVGGRADAFTLVELLVVMSFLALLVVMVQVSLFGVLGRSTFKSQVQDFISTMQMAGSNAAESGHKYEMIIDFAEQSYLLRELTTSDLAADPLAEQTVTQGAFHGNCRMTAARSSGPDTRAGSTAAKSCSWMRASSRMPWLSTG
jgi:type II secretory pathway pseudopilin PulG